MPREMVHLAPRESRGAVTERNNEIPRVCGAIGGRQGSAFDASRVLPPVLPASPKLPRPAKS